MIGSPQHAGTHGQPPRMRRRRKRPDPWRCLSLLRFGAYALATLLMIAGLELLACEMMAPVAVGDDCPVAPSWLSWMLTAVLVTSFIACAVQGIYDYVKREFSQQNTLSGRRYR